MTKSLSRFLVGTLRGRLVISVALVHAIMMSFFIIDLTAHQRDILLDRQTEEATALSQVIAISGAEWIAANDVAGLQELVDAHSLYPEILFVFLADKEGRVLAGTDKPRQGQFMLDLPHEARLTIVSRSSSLVDVAVPAMIAGRHVGWARVGIGQEIASEKLAGIVREGVLYALAAIFIGSVIAWFMGSQITRRLYAIQETIATVRSGNRQARSTLAGDDEAAVMAREFDSMLDDLSKRDVELRESELKYRQLIESLNEGIWMIDEKAVTTFVNPLMAEMLGYTVEEMLGRHLFSFMDEQGIQIANQNLERRKQGFKEHHEFEFMRKNGVRIYTSLETGPVTDMDGNYRGAVAGVIDITESKQAEVALRESELKYRSLIEASSDAIFCVDEKGQYQFTNQLFASTFGESPDYFIGKTFWDIYPKEHADYRFETTKRVFQTGKSESIEVEVPLPDKPLFFYATANPIKDETGKVLLVLTHAVNITDIKNAEAALRKSEERFKALADTSPLAIYASVGVEQKATYINPTFVKLFGYTLEEIPSVKLWWPLAYPDENYRRKVELEWQRRVAKAIETHSEIEPMEVVVNCKDGSQKNILWSFETLDEENWSFGLDLTERKQAEDALRESRDLLSKAINDSPLMKSLSDLTTEKYLEVNDSFCRVSEFSREEVIGKTAIELGWISKDERTKMLQKVLQDGSVNGMELSLRSKNGKNIIARYWGTIIHTTQGDMLFSAGEDITERKQAEEALQAASLYARSLIEASLDPLVTINPDGKITDVNAATENVTGYKRAELIGTDFSNYFTEPEKARTGYQQVFRQGSVYDYPLEIRHCDGHVTFVLYNATVYKNEKGNVIGVFAAARDITERKQAEEALAASREMINNILDNTRIHLWAFDGTHYIYTNKEWFNYTGQDPNFNLTIERWSSAVHPDDMALSNEIWIKNWEAQKEHDNYFRLKRYDGIYRDFYCHAVPIFNGKGDFQYFQGFNIDITERKQAEEELCASENRFRRLANNAPDIIFRYNFVPEMRLAFINPAVEKITLYTPEECYADPLLMINMAHPDDAMLMAEHLQSRQTPDKPLSMRWLDKQGAIHWMESRLVPICDEENQLVAVEGITRDITERKQAELQIEEQIKRLNALHTVDEVIKSSFDLKNTLKVLLDQVAAQLKVDAAAILLFNKDTLTLNYSAGYGFRSTAIQHTRLELGQGFAGRLLLDREIIRIPDLTITGSELAKALALMGENFISYVGVPLIAKGEAVGVLEIFQRTEPNSNPGWFEFLEMLADQAAIAINNTQLFENLKHSNLELIFAYDATIKGWSRAMDLRDMETEAHTQRVTSLTLQLAGQMGIPETDILHIRRGALLHDIGKIGVPDNILRKSSELTDKEWKEMHLHPVYAYEMLAPISYLKPALDIPYCHHEKWDGTGYPRGLKSKEIPQAARLFAVVDVWDALTNERPYRKAWSKEKALEYIREQSGSHFDPQVVENFLKLKKDDRK